MAAFLAGRSQAFAARCLATLDEAARRSERLSAWEPRARGDGVAPPEAEAVAKAGKRWAQRHGVGLGVRGGCEERECQVLAPGVIRGEEGQSDRQGFWHGGLLTALGHPRAVGCGGELFAALGEGVVARGIVPVGSQRRACAPPGGTASEHGTGGTPLGRRDRGLGEHAAAQESGNLVGSDRIVLRRAAMEGLPREGRTEDKREVVFGTQVGEPVPGDEALDGHSQALPRGGHGLAEGCRRRVHRAVEQAVSLLTHDADVHGAGMQVDAAGKRVLIGVDSP